MLDLNGLEILSRLRAIDPQACVIMLTGRGTEEEEAKASTLGKEDFLKTGCSLFELGEVLRRAIARMSKDPVLPSSAAAERDPKLRRGALPAKRSPGPSDRGEETPPRRQPRGVGGRPIMKDEIAMLPSISPSRKSGALVKI
jgi:DNA-binding NarL/FixJ family response regulator